MDKDVIQSGNPLNVLIVDDDVNYRCGLRRTLWLCGPQTVGEIRQVGTGEEADKTLSSWHADCILLDNRMPGISGIDWIENALRAHPSTAIIMITGEGDETTAVEAMKRGATDYLNKGNVSTECLRRTMTNAVERIRLRLALEEQRKAIMEMERKRVMMQSLGAACHHVGQPATVISTYIELIKRMAETPELKAMADECARAAESLGNVLRKLESLTEYESEPYLDDHRQRDDNIIVVR